MSRGANPSAVYIDGVEAGNLVGPLTFVATDAVPPDTVVAVNLGETLGVSFDLTAWRARIAELLDAWLDTVTFVDSDSPDEAAGATIDQLIDNIDDVLAAHRRQP